jgi:hypothetical protein
LAALGSIISTIFDIPPCCPIIKIIWNILPTEDYDPKYREIIELVTDNNEHNTMDSEVV